MESPKAKSGKKGLAPSALDSAATGQTKPTQSLSTKRNELKVRSVSESSDELQGEVTTQPIPKDIDERQTQARLPTKEHFVSPDRSSPTDIVPTKFEGSNKKAKRKHNISERLDIIYLLFGHDATKSGVNGRRTAYLNHERIEIEGKLPGMGLPVSVELRKVVKIFHGKDPSRKVRLFLSKGASPHLGERVDIEFWNSQMKNQLLHVLRDKEIAIHAKESYVLLQLSFSVSSRLTVEAGVSWTRLFKPTNSKLKITNIPKDLYRSTSRLHNLPQIVLHVRKFRPTCRARSMSLVASESNRIFLPLPLREQGMISRQRELQRATGRQNRPLVSRFPSKLFMKPKLHLGERHDQHDGCGEMPMTVPTIILAIQDPFRQKTRIERSGRSQWSIPVLEKSVQKSTWRIETACARENS
jgi:hypothetical protein